MDREKILAILVLYLIVSDNMNSDITYSCLQSIPDLSGPHISPMKCAEEGEPAMIHN